MILEKTVSAVTMTCWENEEADNIACYLNYLQLLLLLLTIFNWCRKKIFEKVFSFSPCKVHSQQSDTALGDARLVISSWRLILIHCHTHKCTQHATACDQMYFSFYFTSTKRKENAENCCPTITSYDNLKKKKTVWKEHSFSSSHYPLSSSDCFGLTSVQHGPQWLQSYC